MMARRAREAGLAVQAITDWRMAHPGDVGLIMSFTNIVSPVMANDRSRR